MTVVDGRLVSVLHQHEDDPFWTWVVFIDSGCEDLVPTRDIQTTETI